MDKLLEVILSAVLTIGSVAGGGYVLHKVGDEVRILALTKASQGLPTLTPFTRKLMSHHPNKPT